MASYNATCLNITLSNVTNSTSCMTNSPPQNTPVSPGICGLSQDRSMYPLLVLCFFALVENVFTCYIIYANKILRTATNIFVFSLCVADALCAGLLLPVAVFCKRSLLYGFLAVIIVFTYCANLTAVTYERLVSITKPLRYQSIITKRVALRIAIFAWVIPTCFSLLPLIWKGDATKTEHKVYIIISLLVFLVAPFFFICFVYTRISIEVHRLLKGSRRLQVYSFDEDIGPRKSCKRGLSKLMCCASSPSPDFADENGDQHGARRGKKSHSLTEDNFDKTISVDLSPDLSECGRLCKRISRRADSCEVVPNNNSFEQVYVCNRAETEKTENEETKFVEFKKSAEVDEKSVQGFDDKKASLWENVTEKDIQNSEESRQKSQNVENNTHCFESHGESSSKECESLIQQEEEPYLEHKTSLPTDLTSSESIPKKEVQMQETPMRGSLLRQESIASNNDVDIQRNGSVDSAAQLALSDTSVTKPKVSIGGSTVMNMPESDSNARSTRTRKNKRSIMLKMKQFYSKEDSGSLPSADNLARRRSRAARMRSVLDEIRASTAFAGVAITYMFTWIPVIYMTFMEAIGKLDKVPVEDMTTVNTWTIAVNTAIDPLFYALILKNFRKTIKKHFRMMRNRCM